MSCFYIHHCVFFNLTHLNLVKKRLNSMIADGGNISKFSCLLLIQFINVEFYINKFSYEFYKILLVLFFKSTPVLLFMQKFGILNCIKTGWDKSRLTQVNKIEPVFKWKSSTYLVNDTIFLQFFFFFFSASQKEGEKSTLLVFSYSTLSFCILFSS